LPKKIRPFSKRGVVFFAEAEVGAKVAGPLAGFLRIELLFETFLPLAGGIDSLQQRMIFSNRKT
jgi:hypothetical protein